MEPQISTSTHKLIDSLDSEEENKSMKKDQTHEKTNPLKSDECALALYVIEDFLDSFNLTFTKSVLKSESGDSSKKYANKTREEVLNELNMMQSGSYDLRDDNQDNESSLNSSSTTNKKSNKNLPILLQLLGTKTSPNNSDIVFEQKINETYENSNPA